MLDEGVQYGVGDLPGEQAVHHLVFTVAGHLGHHRFVTFDAVGDAVGEVQLLGIVELA